MQMDTLENCLIQVVKVLKDYLLLLMIIQHVIIKFLLNHTKNTFFQELKQTITKSKLMEETFIINQLKIQLNNMMKLEKYPQDKVMITQLVVCQALLILKNYKLIAADLSKQKALDADSRAIQQIIFTGKIKATVANTRVIIFYVLEKSKETILEFSKGTTKVL